MDMTARGGSDSVVIQGFGSEAAGRPLTQTFNGTSWSISGGNSQPMCTIVFDDGTLGWFSFGGPRPNLIYTGSATSESFQDSTNPDERGLLFQVPWDCKVDALLMRLQLSSASSDGVLTLYSDPLGTPSSLVAVTVNAESFTSGNNPGPAIITLSSEVSLSKNTNYCLAYKSNGTATTLLYYYPLASTNDRKALPGGTTLAKVTRNNSSGSFTAESPALIIYHLAVRISQFPQTGSGGSPILEGTIVQ
jgi:hypothetical protein